MANSCKMPGCGGVIDIDKGIVLQTGCDSYTTFYACDKCGRVHSYEGELIFNRPGAAAYRREDGSLELVESISFEVDKTFVPGKKYRTTAHVDVCLEGPDGECVAADLVEPVNGTILIFDSIDGDKYRFHVEDGTEYHLHANDLDKIEEVN